MSPRPTLVTPGVGCADDVVAHHAGAIWDPTRHALADVLAPMRADPKRYADNALGFAETFSLEAMTPKFVDLFDSVVERKNHR